MALIGLVARERLGDGGLDALAGHVGNFAIEELGGIGAAGAAEIAAVQPLARDALELAEQMELRLLAGVAVFGVEQMPGEVEEHGGRAHVVQVFERRSTPSPMMPWFVVIDGPTRSGVSPSTESSVEFGGRGRSSGNSTR